MMYMPSIFGENLFDDWMNDFGFDKEFFGKKSPLYGKHEKNLMKTDIREKEDGYELDMDLPGFKKEDIKAELHEGVLTISAAKDLDKDQKDDKGRYIRKERYSGAMSRSFYVGDALTEEDISAKFEDGILKLSIPKKTPQPEVPEKKYIAKADAPAHRRTHLISFQVPLAGLARRARVAVRQLLPYRARVHIRDRPALCRAVFLFHHYFFIYFCSVRKTANLLF